MFISGRMDKQSLAVMFNNFVSDWYRRGGLAAKWGTSSYYKANMVVLWLADISVCWLYIITLHHTLPGNEGSLTTMQCTETHLKRVREKTLWKWSDIFYDPYKLRLKLSPSWPPSQGVVIVQHWIWFTFGIFGVSDSSQTFHSWLRVWLTYMTDWWQPLQIWAEIGLSKYCSVRPLASSNKLNTFIILFSSTLTLLPLRYIFICSQNVQIGAFQLCEKIEINGLISQWICLIRIEW